MQLYFQCVFLQCDDSGGCLAELAIQLAVIMIGKQIINNCQEIMIPCVTLTVLCSVYPLDKIYL